MASEQEYFRAEPIPCEEAYQLVFERAKELEQQLAQAQADLEAAGQWKTTMLKASIDLQAELRQARALLERVIDENETYLSSKSGQVDFPLYHEIRTFLEKEAPDGT